MPTWPLPGYICKRTVENSNTVISASRSWHTDRDPVDSLFMNNLLRCPCGVPDVSLEGSCPNYTTGAVLHIIPLVFFLKH